MDSSNSSTGGDDFVQLESADEALVVEQPEKQLEPVENENEQLLTMTAEMLANTGGRLKMPSADQVTNIFAPNNAAFFAQQHKEMAEAMSRVALMRSTAAKKANEQMTNDASLGMGIQLVNGFHQIKQSRFQLRNEFSLKFAALENKIASLGKEGAKSSESTIPWRLEVLQNGRWDAINCGTEEVAFTKDGLTASKVKMSNSNRSHIRTEQPFVLKLAVPYEGEQQCAQLYYFEVTVLEKRAPANLAIGLCAPDFPFTDPEVYVGEIANSYCMDADTGCWLAGYFFNGFAKFGEQDTVGCGLVLTPDGNVRLFFTKNGQIIGVPLEMGGQEEDENTFSFFPTVTMLHNHCAVEANFGTDPANKPFKWDISKHQQALMTGLALQIPFETEEEQTEIRPTGPYSTADDDECW